MERSWFFFCVCVLFVCLFLIHAISEYSVNSILRIFGVENINLQSVTYPDFFSKFLMAGGLNFFSRIDPCRGRSQMGGLRKNSPLKPQIPPAKQLNLSNFRCFKHEIHLFKEVSSLKVVKIYIKCNKLLQKFSGKNVG